MKMKEILRLVQIPEHIQIVADLAAPIWQEHYGDLLGSEQVTYMVDQFQSVPAISRQIAEQGYRYFLILDDGRPVGFTGIQVTGNRLFLSKLYLQKESRGKGLASQVLAFLLDLCRREGLVSVWLTVNKQNASSQEIYRHWGFAVVSSQVADIGNGYVMDDYIMERAVENAPMPRRPFGQTGVEVSPLGFGAMRLPTHADGSIDEAEAIRLLRTAIDRGINYVDTAYFYHNQQSESLVGKALQDGYREKTYVATKSPMGFIQAPEDFERILEEQLARLQTDHIDFYLLHALSLDEWHNKVLKFGLLDKMEAAKAAGKIRHIGFSFHDTNEAFHTIVDGYDGWEFCQIQLNYVDVNHQAGMEGLIYAASRGLAVIIMEPLLGGKLAVPPASVQAVLSPDKSPVEWALDFLWDRPEVSLILSGMSNREQVEGNLLYAARSAVGMLSPAQREQFAPAKIAYDTMARVSCTQCAYCMPCPFGVNIPGVFEAYNRSALSREEGEKRYAALEGKADLCRACGKCQKACPQHLPIPQKLQEAHACLTEKESTP